MVLVIVKNVIFLFVLIVLTINLVKNALIKAIRLMIINAFNNVNNHTVTHLILFFLNIAL